jgi:hypothetical protein
MNAQRKIVHTIQKQRWPWVRINSWCAEFRHQMIAKTFVVCWETHTILIAQSAELQNESVRKSTWLCVIICIIPVLRRSWWEYKISFAQSVLLMIYFCGVHRRTIFGAPTTWVAQPIAQHSRSPTAKFLAARTQNFHHNRRRRRATQLAPAAELHNQKMHLQLRAADWWMSSLALGCQQKAKKRQFLSSVDQCALRRGIFGEKIASHAGSLYSKCPHCFNWRRYHVSFLIALNESDWLKNSRGSGNLRTTQQGLL